MKAAIVTAMADRLITPVMPLMYWGRSRPTDRRFIMAQLAAIPKGMQVGLAKKYSQIYSTEGRNLANTWLREQVHPWGEVPLIEREGSKKLADINQLVISALPQSKRAQAVEHHSLVFDKQGDSAAFQMLQAALAKYITEPAEERRLTEPEAACA